MSSISPQEIKQEFMKSKMGIAGITILSILILTSIITIVSIPVETFQEWNNPGNWISNPKVAIPIWVNIFMVEKIPEHKILVSPTIEKISNDEINLTSYHVGVNVLICQKGIDDISQHYLAKYGIMAVRRVKESDMIKLSKATGGRVISNLDDLSENDLGVADLVQQKKVESDKWVFIEGCKHPQSVTMLIRGGTQRVIDEVDRSIHDSLMVVKDVMEKPAIVAGGGAPEAFVASVLKEWANNFDGREQLAIKKYAEALETIPLTIAENAGMDPIDTMANLRARQNQGQKWTGIDARNMKIADMMAINVVEPIVVKEQIIKSATEAACMILRIDDVIAVSGAPGGMG